jgi:hypothetical protein
VTESYELAIVFINFWEQETSPANLAHESWSPFLILRFFNGTSKSGRSNCADMFIHSPLDTCYPETTEANMHLKFKPHFFIRIRVWIIQWTVEFREVHFRLLSIPQEILYRIPELSKKTVLTCFPPFQIFRRCFTLMHTMLYCTYLLYSYIPWTVLSYGPWEEYDRRLLTWAGMTHVVTGCNIRKTCSLHPTETSSVCPVQLSSEFIHWLAISRYYTVASRLSSVRT